MFSQRRKLWFGLTAGLFTAWVGLRLVGHVSGLAQNLDAHAPPGAISLLTTLVLALAAWVQLYALSGTKLGRRSLLVAIGTTCGLAGDVAFSGHFFSETLAFGVAMALFGLGHVGYLAAMLTFVRQLVPAERRTILRSWSIATIVCLIGWHSFIYSAEVPIGSYVWAVLGYVVLLAGTAGVGIGMALAKPRLWPMALGGVLFVASDFFIVLRLFNPARDAVVRSVTALDWTWMTYGPAQLLIVYTVPWLIVWRAVRRRRKGAPALGTAEPLVAVNPSRRSDRESASR